MICRSADIGGLHTHSRVLHHPSYTLISLHPRTCPTNLHPNHGDRVLHLSNSFSSPNCHPSLSSEQLRSRYGAWDVLWLRLSGVMWFFTKLPGYQKVHGILKVGVRTCRRDITPLTPPHSLAPWIFICCLEKHETDDRQTD